MPDHDNGDEGLYPPTPEELAPLFIESAEVPEPKDLYEGLLESICGATDDSQPVEQYDGTLGVTNEFVDTHQRPVGQLQWNANLGDIYDNPGNVAGVRWCTGTMISHDLFLTAGHCFDSTPGSWTVPRIDGTNTPISPQEIATVMHVNFNYQVDPSGDLRDEVQYAITELVEYRLDGLDFAVVRLAGKPAADWGIGKIAAGDAKKDDMLAIIGHPAGVPKRIEAGPLLKFDGDRLRYDSIDTLGGNSGSAIYHSPSGEIVGVHTNGGCTSTGGSNSGVRIKRVREESETVRTLDHLPLPVKPGVHRVRQKSSGRYLDAYQSSGKDFNVVTRTSQLNDTQRWRFTPVGMVYGIQQVSSDRFMDAHEHSGEDFSVVTRTDQNNDTQKWVALPVDGALSTYTLQQLSSQRYLDAHVVQTADFNVVTRTAQHNDTQRWVVSPQPDRLFRVWQLSTGRLLDAHQTPGRDFDVVTRPWQNNDTQLWRFTPVGAVYDIQQVSTNRHLDAHESSAQDFDVVTRGTQNNNTQRWVVTYLGRDECTIQQLSNGRFLDAHEHSGEDYSVVTRTRQSNDTQRWRIT